MNVPFIGSSHDGSAATRFDDCLLEVVTVTPLDGFSNASAVRCTSEYRKRHGTMAGNICV
jgi:hypothetical protein